LVWYYTEESMTRVWNSTIRYTDGSTIDFSRREEPKIYSENGKMLAMFNAVVDPRGPGYATYVMSQAIRAN
jgi:hypothetical protein